ncbi:APC family permease [Puia dinghuensis]|uniref:Amino acid permease n=1 Tax=Puia dinghuensis TaxID=1792502 RepID=A0A8J2UEV6_9BACT|nr:amino acid permease [Puia dinghuensis]GGB07906.1 amino acid permease [Puia dinghuensis]
MSKKQLNLFDLSMIVVSLVIGMGIFRTPAVAAARAGTPTIFFLVWGLGGLIALCGALTYAEIGSRYPVTGGYYKIFSLGYHPSLAFSINAIELVSNAGSTAAVGVIGAEYIGQFFYTGEVPGIFRGGVTAAAVGVFYVVNLLGLKMSSRVQNVLTMIKLLLIVLLLASVFGTHPLPVAAKMSAADAGQPKDFLKMLGFALVAVSFSYGGYQQTINFGGEVQTPGRTIPRGISIGIAIIIALYLSLNFVYVKVIGFEHLRSADSIAAQLMLHLFGPVGDTILRCLMFLSVLAYVNVAVMSNPRVMFAMSGEGILPAVFKKTTPKHGVIIWSLTAFSATIVLTLVFSSTVEKIIDYTIFLDSIAFVFSASTLFILRRRRMGEDRDIYRMKGYPFIPAFFILAYISVTISIAINDPKSALYCVFIFLCFFVLYFILKSWKARGLPAGGQT